ncbi:hypothetical protein ERJ75_000776900 [Trypanosoma vivax]|uniref:Uncharacterized protein n=1 Tax=Trypanosoma vivax (strain Y486) TaxID=1055687 RepID=G0U3F6_TRYVY|nr:hypothetical protein TRVL_00531 [Trypanosoma vivax]KAH8613635.1 hypothetical protein ERJ75_000776900 [Trypanosoma vivax]CCC50813.1 conserved hypothetical protein [Trypanosoma vivax Y486]
MNGRELPSCINSNSWKLAQHLSGGDSFPFALRLVDIQVCMDYPAAHHKCCWTRAMLDPVWQPLVNSSTAEKGLASTSQDRQGLISIAQLPLDESRKALSVFVDHAKELSWRRQHKRPLHGNISRVRFVRAPPSLVRIGKGLRGTLSATFSLQRDAPAEGLHNTLFPSFLAVEPCDAVASFINISASGTKQRTSTKKAVLLILQEISENSTSATYSPFEAELNFGGTQLPVGTLDGIPAIQWSFRVYASFYKSPEEQVMLDEPFTRLHEWHPKIAHQRRFSVVGANVDDSIAFSAEKRRRRCVERHIKAAVAQLDNGLKPQEDNCHRQTAILRHVGTLMSSSSVPMEPCATAGNGTLAAIMPAGTVFPLTIQASDRNGCTRSSPPIPGSSSLERLACEIKVLEEHIGVIVQQ